MSSNQTGSEKPNIVFILSDDQGAWAMRCAGTREIYTPNLDRIAAMGMRFDNFFCASPVCSPARASLLTGRIPSAHGIHDWLRSGNLDAERFAAQGRENPYGGYADEKKPIRYLEGQTTYTQLLQENGYTCALSGKWHLGDSLQPQCGFSRWYTIGKGGACYYHADMVENGDITMEHGKYVTELITDKALAYLEEIKDGPFYLGVHYTAPHSPWEADQHPKKWIDYYRDCPFESIPDVPDHPDMTTGPVYGTPARRVNLTGYFAAVSAMDEQIGRILDRLEALSLLENTLVIFTADNGMSMGHHGIWGKGNGTFPMNMYDTAVKVPFLAAWQGHIRAGSVCGELVSAYDLFQTVLELAGIEWNGTSLSGGKTVPLPGKSFAGLLTGDSQARGENAVTVFDEYGPVRMIRTKEWKYVHRYPYGKNELYDLVNDPAEENDLYGQPACGEKTLEMKRRMERWFSVYADPQIDGTREGVTGLGQLDRAGQWADSIQVYYSAPEYGNGGSV